MRLHLSIETAIGPRTVVTQGLSPVDARAIKDAIETLGGRAFLAEDVPLVPMKKRMDKLKRENRRQKATSAQRVPETLPNNVRQLRAQKGTS